MEPYSEIQISALGLKARSKKEVYDLLSNEGGIYFPPAPDAHHKYISQVIVGDKKHVKCRDVKVCRVPHLKKLRVEDLLDFGRRHIDLDSYLPEYDYSKLPNRDWLCNLLNTLLGDEFQNYIQESVKTRVKQVVKKKTLNLKALPEFAEIFNKSDNISVTKGRSHFLIKKYGKRKWDEVEDDDRDKLREAKVKVNQLNSKVENMEMQLKWYEELEEEHKENKLKLAKLYESKLIDSDGEIK